MAGRRQHYIQQHLSRGFAIDAKRRPAQVWVYRRGLPPFITATENYGAEKDFYSPPESPFLDNEITAAESAIYTPFIDAVRAAPPGSQVDAGDASRFVQHLLFRSKHVRSVFAAALSEMLQTMAADFFADRKKFTPFMHELFARHQGQMLARIEAKCPRPLTPSQRAQIAEMLRRNMPQWTEACMNETWPLISEMFRQLVAKVPDMLAAGHRDALRKHVGDTSGVRLAELRRLEWRIWEYDEDLVLGDSCVFSELPDGRFRAQADLTPPVRRHLVPISNRRCLVGASTNQPPDARTIREGAARCSFDCFCANTESSEYRRLQLLIGHDAMPLSAEEIQHDGIATLQKVLREKLEQGIE